MYYERRETNLKYTNSSNTCISDALAIAATRIQNKHAVCGACRECMHFRYKVELQINTIDLILDINAAVCKHTNLQRGRMCESSKALTREVKLACDTWRSMIEGITIQVTKHSHQHY